MRHVLIFSLEEHYPKCGPTYLNFHEHFRSSMNRHPNAKIRTHWEASMTGEFGEDQPCNAATNPLIFEDKDYRSYRKYRIFIIMS